MTHRLGEFYLDVDRRVLRGTEKDVPLSEKLFGVLLCLVRAGGGVVTKDELIAEVWKSEETSDATVTQHISMLRRLLGEGARDRKYILTAHGRGYRLATGTVDEALDTQMEPSFGDGDALDGDAATLKLYLAGSYYLEKRDRAGLQKAITCFRASMALSPSFAPASTGVAHAQTLLLFHGFVPWKDILPSALEHVSNALKINPKSSRAHCILAMLQSASWDTIAAQRSLTRAAELSPNDPFVFHARSCFYYWCGDTTRAAREARWALTLDPGNHVLQTLHAEIAAFQGNLSGAISLYTDILQREPSFQLLIQARCDAFIGSGQPDFALADLAMLPRTAENLSRLACAFALIGNRERAIRILNDLRRKAAVGYVPPNAIAQVHINLGQYDEANRIARSAIASRDVLFPLMTTSPLIRERVKDRALRETLRFRTPRDRGGARCESYARVTAPPMTRPTEARAASRFTASTCDPVK